MSFRRLVFYSALIGGWSGFAGWLLAEILVMRRSPNSSFEGTVFVSILVGMAISAGLSQVATLVNPRRSEQLRRFGIGAAGGLVAGLVVGLILGVLGMSFGHLPAVVEFFLRVLGWTLLGVTIGSVEGVCELSIKKLQNGAIGGAVGGAVGGALFAPIAWIVGSDMSSRAVGFVLLGACIGLFVGLAQVVFKEAWLTVTAGFRPGRQLLLGQRVTTLGTSESCDLIFISFGAKGVEPVHVKIFRRQDGNYFLKDDESRTGTRVNGEPVVDAVLRDGDEIAFGPNIVRFNERIKRQETREMERPDEALALKARQKAPQREATRHDKGMTGAEALQRLLSEPSRRRVDASSSVSFSAAAEPPKEIVPESPPSSPPVGEFVAYSKSTSDTSPKPVGTKQVAASAPLPTSTTSAAPPNGTGTRSTEPSAAVVTNACPVCSYVMTGPPGKRDCANCGTRF